MTLLARSIGSKLQLPPLRSSPTSSNNLTRVFLQLPPTYRAFHASPRSQFIPEIVATSHSALDAVHLLSGLPWAYSIPLFAVALRLTVMLPMGIYVRKNNQKQVALAPLVQSWQHALRHQTMREFGHLGPQVATRKLLIKTRAKRGEIFQRWGCETYKNFLPVLQIPIFLSVMEALRQMSGAREGWLGMMQKTLQSGTDVALTASETAAKLTDLVDPTLATEGALWFQNLLLPDPQLALPFMLSASILLNVYGGSNKGMVLGKWQTRFKRIMGTIGLAVGPLMMHMPSALLVYWLSSSLTGYLQAVLLDKVMPIDRSVQPCKPKRPWRTGLGVEGGMKAGEEEKK